LVIAGCIISIILISLLLQSEWLAKWLLPAAGFMLLAFLLVLTKRQAVRDRQGMLVLIALILSSVIFWMIFLQLFFSASLFIERLVNKQVFSFNIPTTAFYALESVFVILLGPLFAWSWQTLGVNHRNPSPFIKFILAIVFVGLGFFALTASTYFYGEDYQVNPLWIVLSYLLITIGEMLLSPIGLSAITLLAPRKILGMMMGTWFVALGFGGQFAGLLAKLSAIPNGVTGLAEMQIYRNAFMDYGLIAFGVSAGLVVLYWGMNRLFASAFNLQVTT
jgi:POT family proton-dependent oligopeptide transporter